MQYNTIRLEQDKGLAHITLCRPDESNTVTPEFSRELRDAAERLAADSSLRALLLTAEGKMFSAGGDIGTFAADGERLPQTLPAMLADFHGAIEPLASLQAPIVTAVGGTAAGGGFSLVLMSNFVLASDKARFVMAYTGAGLSPDGSSTYFLPRIVGLRRAEELMVTNRPLSAAEALEWGIINRVVPESDLLDEAEKLARQLAQGPTRAYATVRQLLLSSFSNTLSEQLQAEGEGIVAMAGTQDAQGGIAAFAAKKSPEFKGQ